MHVWGAKRTKEAPAPDGMDGMELLRGLSTGTATRPPWIPLLGTAAAELGQVDVAAFTGDAQAHAVAVAQAAGALSADVVTVGWGTDPAVGADAVHRIQPMLAGRGVAGCLLAADVAGARAYCEAGAGMVLLVRPDRSAEGRFRTLANACAFYQALAILVDPDLEDAAGVAAGLGLHGAIVGAPTGDEPGVIGGGVSPTLDAPPHPPRPERFFWSLPAEVPPDAAPEAIAALGARLTSA
jgi:hypothetical protein